MIPVGGRRPTKCRVGVGDRVRWSYLGKEGGCGVVLKVTPKGRGSSGSGGSWFYVRVRWDTGAEGSHEDRVLKLEAAQSLP